MGFRPVPSTPPILVSQGLSSKLIARRRYCRENFWLQKTESSQLNTAGSVVYRYVYMRIPIHKPTGFTSRPTGYQHPPDRSFLFCILRHLYPCIPPSILSCRHWNPTDMKRFFYNAFIHLRIFHFYCWPRPQPQLQPWMWRPRTKKTLCVR